MCDKGFIWNPSNCECKCDKLCDVGEYLYYKTCNCRNKLADKSVEECSKNIDGNEMLYNETLDVISLNDYKKMCNYCTLYIVLVVLFFVKSICIASVFIYFHWYLKKDNVRVCVNFNPSTQTKVY